MQKNQVSARKTNFWYAANKKYGSYHRVFTVYTRSCVKIRLSALDTKYIILFSLVAQCTILSGNLLNPCPYGHVLLIRFLHYITLIKILN